MKILTNSDKKHVREVLNNLKDELKNTEEGALKYDVSFVRASDKYEGCKDNTILEKIIKLEAYLKVKPKIERV